MSGETVGAICSMPQLQTHFDMQGKSVVGKQDDKQE